MPNEEFSLSLESNESLASSLGFRLAVLYSRGLQNFHQDSHLNHLSF